MAVGFPVKDDYATGDVLTAANLNDFAGTLNTVPTSYGSTAGKNVLINGLLDIWQRNTTATFSASAYNAQDRWYNYASTSSTFARETSVIPTGCTYSCKVTVGASAAAVQSEQVIETLNAAPYAGKTMTLSGHFQSSATPTITFVVYHSSSVDVAVGGSWTAITATSGGSGTAGASSFTRISGVYAIPSTAKSIKVLWYSSSIASAGILYWGGMQFEAGSLPTTLTRNAGTIQGELAACQRYYYVFVEGGSKQIGFGQMNTASAMVCNVQLPNMRTTPTLDATSGTDFYTAEVGGALDGFNSFTILRASNNNAGIFNSTEVSGTAGQCKQVFTGNASAKIAFSAEL
jgi:hypothetical protein